ncbi:addiction module protein [Propionibacteriaceae bacterium Y2011]
MSVDEVRAAIRQLAMEDRVALAAELLDDLEHPSRASEAEVDSAWSAELIRRLDLAESGTVEGLTLDQVEAQFGRLSE